MNDQVRLVDVYCPRCWGFNRNQLEMTYGDGGEWEWNCDRCGSFTWPFEADINGLFTWVWDDQHPSPNPGCPWCQTRNIQWSEGDFWSCQRSNCHKAWQGTWTQRNKDWRTDRWLIRIPVSSVPWRAVTKYGVFSGIGARYPAGDYWKYGPGSTEIEGVDDAGCGQGCEYICYHY